MRATDRRSDAGYVYKFVQYFHAVAGQGEQNGAAAGYRTVVDGPAQRGHRHCTGGFDYVSARNQPFESTGNLIVVHDHTKSTGLSDHVSHLIATGRRGDGDTVRK